MLLADLNIGEPGDGFTVVSAMRRIQPSAITIILTGYPDFDTALNAIRNQVDDYFVKPPNMAKLIETIEGGRRGGATTTHPVAGLTVAAVIDQHAGQITEDWLTITSEVPALAAAPLTPEERVDHVPALLARISAFLRCDRETPGEEHIVIARVHGRLRRTQGYTILMIIDEARLLDRCIFQCLQSNLLSIKITSLIPDIIRVSEMMHAQIGASVAGFLAPEESGRASS